MIDFLVPPKKSLIKSKEMHGHVILDIHNTKSGFTERIEKHNTVTTNANEFMWWNYLAYLRANSAYRPSNIYDGLYGGVFLFEDAISGGTMLPFGANHWLGYAGSETTVTGNRGVYNSTESTSDIDNGAVTSVWDWSTSQANGTIGSVARTSLYVGNGYFGMGNNGISNRLFWFSPQDSKHTLWTDHYVPIGIDKANDLIYLYTDTTGTYYSAPFNPALSIKWGTLDTDYFPSCDSMLTPICTTEIGDNNTERWFDVANQKIYAASVTEWSTSNDGVVKIGVVDLTAGTPEENVTTVTMAGCYLYGNNTSYISITDGYIYISGYAPADISRSGIYRLKISDNSTAFFDIYTVMENAGYDSTGNYPVEFCKWGVSGVRCIIGGTKSNTGYTREVLVDQDGTAYVDEPYFQGDSSRYLKRSLGLGLGDDGYPFVITRGRTYTSSYESYDTYAWFFMGTAYDYLATYCNLDTPVSKTSSETLKLTYTLSDS